MTTVGWVLVFVGIAVAGLVMVACFAVWLWRKAMALLDETAVLLERSDQLIGLLDQIELPDDRRPQPIHRPERHHDRVGDAVDDGLARGRAT